MRIGKIILILVAFFAEVNVAVSQELMVDPNCNTETRNLYRNLTKISAKGVMFGHYNDITVGIGWKNVDGRSDVKEVTGEYPAVFGWDLGFIENGKENNVEGISFDKMTEGIKKAYALGAINTISWHCDNPISPLEGFRSTRKASIEAMFNDSGSLRLYKLWLDKVASFLLGLKNDKGQLIPIIFRPFHENNGSWFWWGKGNVSGDSYIKLWRFTVKYLRDTRNVHNLIYAYSPNGFRSKEDYLEDYPGDSFVDLLGFDYYVAPSYREGDSFEKRTTSMTRILSEIAAAKGKPWAFTETGFRLVPDSNWWTRSLLPVLQNSGACYVMFWTNSGKFSYFCPYPGQGSADDFRVFYNSPSMIFQKRVLALKVYENK
jgi:mannan endo-1,4-beta-mannosidase